MANLWLVIVAVTFAAATTAGTGLAAAVVVASMLAVCTMRFAAGGFAATRHAGTMMTWQAWRHARRAAGTRSDLISSWAGVAAPAKLAPAGPPLERRRSMPRRHLKEIRHASAIA